MSTITTHILDTARGVAAADVPLSLFREEHGEWSHLATTRTDADGRAAPIRDITPLTAGTYRIRFETGQYLRATGSKGFYPYVDVVFTVDEAARHHHVPLLLSPFGYSTYRGT